MRSKCEENSPDGKPRRTQFIDLLGPTPIDLEQRLVLTTNQTQVHLLFRKQLADPTLLINICSTVPELTPASFTMVGPVLCITADLDLISLMNQGAVIVFISDEAPFAVMNPSFLKRQPAPPQVERSVRGPLNAFTEDIFDNLAAVRRMLPDPELAAEEWTIGRRTKTKIAISYLTDVANPGLIAEVRARLKRIDIDGIEDPGVVEELIQDNRWTPFPLNQSTERPDKTVAFLLEGRIAVFFDNSPRVIILPVALNDLYQAADDYYFNFWSGSMIRTIRFLGSLIAVSLSGLYIALVGSSPQLLPITLGLEVASQRVGMPLPLSLEVILTEVVVELFREAGLRLPRGVNITTGVSTGILVGFALIMTGYISTPTLIVVGITAIASFSTPNFSVGFTWRILKYFLIFAATFLGYYGFILGSVVILAHVAGLSSFGSPYSVPWAPIQVSGVFDSLVRFPHWLQRGRPLIAKPQQQKRQKPYNEE